MTEQDYPTHPVAGLQQVLAAMADPIRLEMVRRMHQSGEPTPCSLLYDGIGKSTASHHFKTLREAGLTRTIVDGRSHSILLRRAELDAKFPGLVDALTAG